MENTKSNRYAKATDNEKLFYNLTKSFCDKYSKYDLQSAKETSEKITESEKAEFLMDMLPIFATQARKKYNYPIVENSELLASSYIILKEKETSENLPYRIAIKNSVLQAYREYTRETTENFNVDKSISLFAECNETELDFIDKLSLDNGDLQNTKRPTEKKALIRKMLNDCNYSERDKQVIALKASGYTLQEIAVKMNVSQPAITKRLKAIAKIYSNINSVKD